MPAEITYTWNIENLAGGISEGNIWGISGISEGISGTSLTNQEYLGRL